MIQFVIPGITGREPLSVQVGISVFDALIQQAKTTKFNFTAEYFWEWEWLITGFGNAPDPNVHWLIYQDGELMPKGVAQTFIQPTGKIIQFEFREYKEPQTDAHRFVQSKNKNRAEAAASAAASSK
jgi:hypothetical protein